MALQKQDLNINFSQGLDTKTDPFQVQPGKFLTLQNSIFDKAGRLTKRNGYQQLTTLPNSTSSFVTTFNGDLTALGTNLYALSNGSNQWINKGALRPAEVDVLSMIRSNTGQVQVDAAVASNNLVCLVYIDQDNSNLSNYVYKYAIADAITGQSIVEPTFLADYDNSSGLSGGPRVFVLGNYFIILFTNLISSNYHLQYLAIQIYNPSQTTGPTDIVSNYGATFTTSFDGYVYGSNLYIAFNAASSAGMKITYLTSGLILTTIQTVNAHPASLVSLTVDPINHVLWLTQADIISLTYHIYATAYDLQLNSVLSTTLVISSATTNGNPVNLTSLASYGTLTIFVERSKSSFNPSSNISYINFINTCTITQAGSTTGEVLFNRKCGIASRAFTIGTGSFLFVEHQSPEQNTYFLLDTSHNVIGWFAYENAGPHPSGIHGIANNRQGYLPINFPGVSVFGNSVYVAQRYQDLLVPLNNGTNPADAMPSIYAQTGLNLYKWTIGTELTNSVEIGTNLNINGGFIWAYDGYSVTEQGFFLWPETLYKVANGSGNIDAGEYFYVATNEWTDNQGNLFRSAPSVP